MQAERIALLSSALSSPTSGSFSSPLSVDTTFTFNSRPLRSAPLTPPLRAVPGFPSHLNSHMPVARSQSQFDLRSRYVSPRVVQQQPIYQTSGHASIPPSPVSAGWDFHFPYEAPSSAFLPSFLSDIVDSPTLSASSGSADLSSLEDLSLGYSPAVSVHALGATADTPAKNPMPSGSIWGLDGQERKAWMELRTRSSQDAIIVGMRQCTL
jgi:hypothetical protein